jgi:hypothetical protein
MAQHDEPSMTSISQTAQRTVMLYSVLAGLCKLIPIPFLDDFVLALVSRRMIRVLLAQGGLSTSEASVQRLTRERTGCPLGCLYTLIFAPLKKIVRSLVFVFAFRDCVDLASRWLHRGYLVASSVERGLLGEAELAEKEGGWPVALAIEETLLAQDTSPINQLVRQSFTHSRKLLRAAARDLARRLRPARTSATETTEEAVAAAAAVEGEALSAILAELSEAFWSQQRYLADLEARFDEKLVETTRRMEGDQT